VSSAQAKRPAEVRSHERVILGWLRHTDGIARLPSPDEVAKATQPQSYAGKIEAQDEALERVMGEFARFAGTSEARARTATTASALALTITGLLLTKGSPVSSVVVAIIGMVALVGFYLGLLGQASFVGKPPARQLTSEDVEDALVFCTRKEFYAQVGLIVAAATLGIEALSFVFSVF
jgi:hypothetical protein